MQQRQTVRLSLHRLRKSRKMLCLCSTSQRCGRRNSQLFQKGKSVRQEADMKIDGNELMKKEILASRSGNSEESWRLKQEFMKQVKENGDHCPCPEACPHHGNCFECVTFHRGHQDHLPYCMWEMVNQKISGLSALTEGSFCDYEKTQKENKDSDQ